MSSELLLDAAGRRRSPAAMPGHNARKSGWTRGRGAITPLRHAHAVELAREGVPLPVIQRPLGHSYVSTTSVTCKGSTSRVQALGRSPTSYDPTPRSESKP
jgi:site-specific recombinase XerD